MIKQNFKFITTRYPYIYIYIYIKYDLFYYDVTIIFIRIYNYQLYPKLREDIQDNDRDINYIYYV